MNITSSSVLGDAVHKCEQHDGYLNKQCLLDRKTIIDMQAQAPNTAIKYTAVILSCYVIGLVILWLHFVKQKYGQLSFYDIYYELCPHLEDCDGNSNNSPTSSSKTAENGRRAANILGTSFHDDEENVMRISRQPLMTLVPRCDHIVPIKMAPISKGRSKMKSVLSKKYSTRSANSNSIQNTEVYETMEVDDEANCSTDPDDPDGDTAKSSSSTHDSSVITNNSPTLMMVNNSESPVPKAHLIILAETRL